MGQCSRQCLATWLLKRATQQYTIHTVLYLFVESRILFVGKYFAAGSITLSDQSIHFCLNSWSLAV